jgi:hypothetical protein
MPSWQVNGVLLGDCTRVAAATSRHDRKRSSSQERRRPDRAEHRLVRSQVRRIADPGSLADSDRPHRAARRQGDRPRFGGRMPPHFDCEQRLA